ncbi:hypothetical protein [Runella sp.]|uniref:hypothetical protein n=1 Tax=Runella sp. TaxID=1960881 RepID=UPI003D130651
MRIIIGKKFNRDFKRLAKKYVSLATDIANLFNDIRQNPQLGIPLGQDCYKIRLAISSKKQGKSGGARIITCVKLLMIKCFFSLSTINQKGKILLTKSF